MFSRDDKPISSAREIIAFQTGCIRKWGGESVPGQRETVPILA